MSSRKEADARSSVGAHGDRRQQPAPTKTLSGIRSKMHTPRKRPSTNQKVDEEEWNQRMQTWEKKRQRLSGSDWDRSFREAVRNRLKGKKPWRTPISSVKASLHKADRNSNSFENENNGRSQREFSRSEWESFTFMDTDFGQKSDHQDTKRKEDAKMVERCLEVAGLKRETSKMELKVTAVALSGGSHQSVQSRTPKESTNLESLENNILNATIKTSETTEMVEDIVLPRINSLILTDANNLTQSSRRYVKTVLSPIQSESDCSKMGAEVQSGDGQNTSEETADVKEEKSTGDASLRLPEIRKEHAESKRSLPSEQSLVTKSFDECEMKMNSISNLSFQNKRSLQSNQESEWLPGVQKEIWELMDTNEMKLKNEEARKSPAQKTNAASQTTLQLCPTISEMKASKEGDEKSTTQQPAQKSNKDGKKRRKKKVSQKDPKKDIAEPRKVRSLETRMKITDAVMEISTQPHQPDSISGDKGFNQKINVTYCNAEGNPVNVNEKAKIKRCIKGHEIRVGTSVGSISPSANSFEHAISGNTPSRSSKPLAQEIHALPSKSKCRTPVSKNKRENYRKFKETLCNSSSLTATYSSKERMLHAIFSSPDTEIFGSRKKPPIQPVFIRTAFTEDIAPDDCQLVIVESRPQSDESLMVSDESVETLSRSPGLWYREFRHPVMTSEESEADQMKSDCYREIIIDRSGCRSLNDGRCLATVPKGYDKCCVRRYEVCHDTSKCSLKSAKKGNRQIYFADDKSIHEASSVESWYYTD